MKTKKYAEILNNPAEYKICKVCRCISSKWKRKCWFCGTKGLFDKNKERIKINIQVQIDRMKNVIDKNHNDTIQIG